MQIVKNIGYITQIKITSNTKLRFHIQSNPNEYPVCVFIEGLVCGRIRVQRQIDSDFIKNIEESITIFGVCMYSELKKKKNTLMPSSTNEIFVVLRCVVVDMEK